MDMTCPRRWTFGLANFSRWTLWITKGSLAVLDQGLISGSNFLIGILLARWLLPAQYGAYGLAFEIFLLLSFFHQALLIEPQRVFGPSDYPDCLARVLRRAALAPCRASCGCLRRSRHLMLALSRTGAAR